MIEQSFDVEQSMRDWKRKTGGYAFPQPKDCQSEGMTVRDYFAAKAMQGILAGNGGVTVSVSTTMSATPGFIAYKKINISEEIAASAYAMADIMLVERAK